MTDSTTIEHPTIQCYSGDVQCSADYIMVRAIDEMRIKGISKAAIVDYLESIVSDIKRDEGHGWFQDEVDAVDPKPPADDEPDDEDGFEEDDDESDRLDDEARARIERSDDERKG